MSVVYLFRDMERILDNMRSALPVPEPDPNYTFRKIDEVSMRAVELAGDEVCEKCGRSASETCKKCPLDDLFARIG